MAGTKAPDTRQDQSRKDTRIPEGLTIVLIAGALGGLASWVYTLTVGRALDMPWYAAAVCCLLLGSVAGLLGVYIIAKTDARDRIHLIAFAVLCGLCWRPIIDGAGAYVQLKSLAEEEAASTDALLASAGTSGPAAKPAELGDAAVRAMRASVRLNDPRSRPATQAQVNRTIETLSRSGPEGVKQAEKVKAEASRLRLRPSGGR